MTPIEEQSRDGLYSVYHTEEGRDLYVLRGLRPDDQVESPVMQQWIHAHYGTFFAFYWILFGLTLVYLVGVHIVMPLARRFKLF